MNKEVIKKIRIISIKDKIYFKLSLTDDLWNKSALLKESDLEEIEEKMEEVLDLTENMFQDLNFN